MEHANSQERSKGIPSVQFNIVTKVLTDGSEVFDVEVSDGYTVVTLNCADERAAEHLLSMFNAGRIVGWGVK